MHQVSNGSRRYFFSGLTRRAAKLLRHQLQLTRGFGRIAGESQIAHLSSIASPTKALTLSAASGTFIPTSTYTDLVTALSEINDRNPFSEGSTAARLWTENEIKVVLGQVGDIWPLEIRG